MYIQHVYNKTNLIKTHQTFLFGTWIKNKTLMIRLMIVIAVMASVAVTIFVVLSFNFPGRWYNTVDLCDIL